MNPEDIQKWNVTSLDTLKALLKVSKKPNMDTKVITCLEECLWHAGVQSGLVGTLCYLPQGT